MDNGVLITGASGLLGRALVQQFNKMDFQVLAQYHQNPGGMDSKQCRWLHADFSSREGIRDFLVENCLLFRKCRYLVNNYGPITYKDIGDLTADDFYFDFHHNVITTFEITDFFIRNTAVEGVVNIGFGDLGVVKPYKKILTYAAAKNALQLMTLSFAGKYKHIKFNLVSPTTLKGAELPSPDETTIPPSQIALQVIEALLGKGM